MTMQEYVSLMQNNPDEFNKVREKEKYKRIDIGHIDSLKIKSCNLKRVVFFGCNYGKWVGCNYGNWDNCHDGKWDYCYDGKWDDCLDGKWDYCDDGEWIGCYSKN